MIVGVLRAALAMVVVSLGLVLAVEAPAFACTCQPESVKKQVSRADVVFVGTVDGLTPADGMMFVYDITATRTYKGAPQSTTSVTSSQQPSACGLGELKVGKDYLFFGQGTAAPYTADVCAGSGPANTDRLNAVEKVAGDGLPVDPPPPPTATRTVVEDSPPMGFARAAAPGAAAVLIGLLGLIVVRRMARRA